MKNPTILKDELSLLRADKSAVITELRIGGKKLNSILEDITKFESKLADVKGKILDETARLDDTRSRAVSVRDELTILIQELKNVQNANEISKTKTSQEVKLHLGRIKELEEQENSIIIEIGRLKNLFDKNSKVYNENESARLATIRNLDSQVALKTVELNKIVAQLNKHKEEDKKITKDRLKREDKIRIREKNLDSKELAIAKWEEDLITMSKDMTIVYGRLKELYSKSFPDIDLDKLIMKAI